MNSSSKDIKLSILIPSYNDEKYIRYCIESLLHSQSSDFEIIVSDDCSSDKTLEVIKTFSDKRLSIFRTTKRLGVVGNWINCFEKSSGEWLLFLGSDDFLEAGSIDSILNNLKSDKNIVYSFPIVCFEDQSNNIINTQGTPEKLEKIFGREEITDWSGMLRNFNHDELVQTIFNRKKMDTIKALMPFSYKSVFFYWTIAIFYNSKVISLGECKYNKRYLHKTKRVQWKDMPKKSVLIDPFLGLYSDLYNAIILAFCNMDLKMLYKLLFYSRYHATQKGGLFGILGKKAFYCIPGAFINFCLAPMIVIYEAFRKS